MQEKTKRKSYYVVEGYVKSWMEGKIGLGELAELIAGGYNSGYPKERIYYMYSIAEVFEKYKIKDFRYIPQ